MHYYKRNIGDYHKKAGRLSMLQHGAYTLLLDACYDREEFPTLDQAIDWCWASSKEEIEAVQFVLKKFFFLDGEAYVQTRVRDEVEKFQGNSATNARIAKEREAKRRKEKETERNDSDTNRAPTVNEPPPNHKPLTINQEPLTKNQDKNICPDSVETSDVDSGKPKTKPDKKPKRPPCPHSEIIDLYHEILPTCTGVLESLWPGSKGAADLRDRWNQSEQHQDLEFWKWFFIGLSKLGNGFYVSDEGGPWKADLRWLIKKTNFINICEKIAE